MGRVAAVALALMAFGAEAQAYSNFAELMFGKRSHFGRHVDDEAFGDEFKRPAHGLGHLQQYGDRLGRSPISRAEIS